MVESLSVSGVTLVIISLVLKYFFSNQEKNAAARTAELNAKMDTAGQTLLNLQIAMAGKMDRICHDEICKEKSDDIWDRLNRHCHDAAVVCHTTCCRSLWLKS